VGGCGKVGQVAGWGKCPDMGHCFLCPTRMTPGMWRTALCLYPVKDSLLAFRGFLYAV
jgi:hypothetical protein